MCVCVWCGRPDNDNDVDDDDDDDEDISPEAKAQREKIRRQQNNARERSVNTHCCLSLCLSVCCSADVSSVDCRTCPGHSNCISLIAIILAHDTATFPLLSL